MAKIAFVLLALYLACSGAAAGLVMRPADTYTAAVVEFGPVPAGDSPEILGVNARSYVRLIEKAARAKADIIVFPEAGLTGLELPKDSTSFESLTTIIPGAEELHVPCSQARDGVHEVMEVLSCAAEKHAIYVVVNIAEKVVECRDEACSDRKVLFYNSNVVFDRRGMVVSRYRKTNLYMEPEFSVLPVPELETFTTDFGVTFGNLVCFDLLFQKPTLNLTRELNVKNIVLPVAWYSNTPFLTAIQLHTGWAFAENVNLLVSGLSKPESGHAGSGIYSGRNGPAAFLMPLENAADKLVIATIPKDPTAMAPVTLPVNPPLPERPHSAPSQDLSARMRLMLEQEDITSYSSALVTGNQSLRLCHGSFCCSLDVTLAKVDPDTKYRFVAYDGYRHFPTVVSAGVQSCALVQCSGHSVRTCSSALPSSTTFARIRIQGSFDDLKNTLVMPSTVRSDILPFKTLPDFQEVREGDRMHVTMELRGQPMNDVATFGIWARKYTKDTPDKGQASL